VDYTTASVMPKLACAALKTSASAPDVTIAAADTIPAAAGVPEHCRVSGTIAPAIAFEVDLPAKWNDRFYMFGNGGAAGERFDEMPRQIVRDNGLRHNFVVAQTNTGHDAKRESATFLKDHQKLVDYAYRAVHLTVLQAKRIAAMYYDRQPAHSYWDGCSTGGREGLMEAQRFPDDFDGIVIVAPVLNVVDTQILGMWLGRALDEGKFTLAKVKTVADALYKKCDARDGIADGVIADPRKCDFDPARDVKQCTAGSDRDDCLTPDQDDALHKIYGGVVSNGKPYFFGYIKGPEAAGQGMPGRPPTSGWNAWMIPLTTGPFAGKALQVAFAAPELVMDDPPPGLTYKNFDFDKGPSEGTKIRALLNATNPDLTAFRKHGGKLLQFHGWADPALSPLMSIDYYEKASAASGPNPQDFYRLFMVPGMFHCRGGVGTDHFDTITNLIDWVEGKKAPERILASHMVDNKVTRTRPLCLYPQVANYKGSGSTDDAANFTCGAEK
jgi:feruloyl esterase